MVPSGKYTITTPVIREVSLDIRVKTLEKAIQGAIAAMIQGGFASCHPVLKSLTEALEKES